MTTERLEWLKLSAPAATSAKKPSQAGQTPCPTCGWPVAAGTQTCPHCEHDLTGETSPDHLAELDLKPYPRIVEIAPAPEHWFDDAALDTPALYQLRLQAEKLRVTTGFDRLICLDDVSVDHYQHQLNAALRALRDMRGRALLADEVGLGKTIEAGIVMKELIERGLVSSVLIITPASLTWQWHEEMRLKFHEEFTVLEKLDQLDLALDSGQMAFPDLLQHTQQPIATSPCRWIISLDRAKTARWSQRLLARDYDLLIVDEAHKLKNQRTKAYGFVSQIQKRYVLMLTATPVHNNLLELYNLVTILRPGHLGTRRAFKDNFVESARQTAYRTIRHSQSPGPYQLVKPHDRRRGRTWKAGRSKDFAQLATMKMDEAGKKVVREVNYLRAQGYQVYGFEADYLKPTGSAYDETIKDKLLLSRFTCRLRLKSQARPERSDNKRHVTPRNPAILRGLLREIMIRNRRRSVGVRFPPRKAAIYSLNLTPPERELYDGVTAYIRRQLQGRPKKGAGRMALMTLQKQLCSSPHAAARALKNLVRRQDDDQLLPYLSLAWDIHRGRKTDAVLSLLEQHPGKFLIFTDYVPTLHALHSALDLAGHETVLFYGGLSSLAKVEAVRQFRRSARVMVSTQSGSEGHNLQFCHQLINYDLPWNPMRIEQRIGRLHRLGQKETVSVFNLSANDTIEAHVLDLLAHKIRMFELVIGELDLILGELGPGRSFENRVEAAWANSFSEAELLRMMAELNAALDKSRTASQQIKSVSDELSDLLETFDEDLC